MRSHTDDGGVDDAKSGMPAPGTVGACADMWKENAILREQYEGRNW
jgi:hypothetical protein